VYTFGEESFKMAENLKNVYPRRGLNSVRAKFEVTRGEVLETYTNSFTSTDQIINEF